MNKYNNKSKIVTTKVLDRTAPKVPTVTKITTKTKVVSGKGEAGSVVYIYNGKTKIGQATIDTKGNYKLNIKLQKKGTKLTIYALDKAKNKSTVTTIKVG
ncbi:Ig-like domain-containing protein [Staphylococcus debuckii]|uniref:Ig-like domain-containing protein n=1 Tax=Staphylococcus debuckii TaxID=2044912 RepID=UPI0013DF5504|nr:Ig-like domain-containing protein [Staphylococcus debuckii]